MEIDNTKIKKIGVLAVCALGILIGYKLLFPYPNIQACLLNENRKGGHLDYVYNYCKMQNYEVSDILSVYKSGQYADFSDSIQKARDLGFTVHKPANFNPFKPEYIVKSPFTEAHIISAPRGAPSETAMGYWYNQYGAGNAADAAANAATNAVDAAIAAESAKQ